jgi:hypothetical protein
MMKIEDNIDQNRGDCRVSHAVHRGEKIPRFWLDAMLGIAPVFIWGSGAHIYKCTGGGEYTKNPLEKYNNRKTNTYLIC